MFSGPRMMCSAFQVQRGSLVSVLTLGEPVSKPGGLGGVISAPWTRDDTCLGQKGSVGVPDVTQWDQCVSAAPEHWLKGSGVAAAV